MHSITVANFQTMISEYGTLSPGYQSRAATLHVLSIPPLRSAINYFGNLPACAFYLFIRQPMGRKSALRREIPWILRGFQGRLSC